jgi:hypothetical protein
MGAANKKQPWPEGIMPFSPDTRGQRRDIKEMRDRVREIGSLIDELRKSVALLVMLTVELLVAVHTVSAVLK